LDLHVCRSRDLDMKSLTEPTCRVRRIDERPLIVIDDLFRPDFIKVFDQFLKTLPFSLADYDVEDSRHVLHWKHEFSLDEVTTNPLLSFVYSHIRSVAEKACPELRIQLKRVHCNTSLYGDMQFPHHDITPGMTWLYYSNPVWEPNWMAETIFYDSQEEPVYAVFPKPGRVIVFAADILHRGGVPSRECVEARRSLAFKFLNRAR
jgi:SM-20-related protein